MSQFSIVLKRSQHSVQHIDRLVYPRPLPVTFAQELQDENGLSQVDKATLRQAWRLIMPFHVRIGRDVFYSFLTKEELIINKFRDKDYAIMLNRLHYHAIMLMRLLDQVIFNFLDKPMELHAKLDESMPKHLEHGVTTENMLMVATRLKERLLTSAQLANHKSTRLEIALTKLLTMVAGFNIQSQERHRLTTQKYSIMQQMK